MPATPITLDALRHYAVARTLFAPTSLSAAIKRLGFVQADPICARWMHILLMAVCSTGLAVRQTPARSC